MDAPKKFSSNPSDLRKKQDAMITECMETESKLSKWEKDFIQSIREQFDEGRFLTERQLARLEEIYENYID